MRTPVERSHLTVYLTRSCNLACAYCYAGAEAAREPDAAAVLGGLESFLRRAPAGAKVTFLGGEPLLAGRLLRRAILRIRAAAPDMPVRLFTNGTLLDRGWLAFFSAQSVSVTLSLDGDGRSNDAARRFRRGKASVFAAVLRRLPAAERAYTSVNLVVSPGNADGLAANLLALRALGFGSLAWTPDLTAFWRAPELARLAASARRVKLDYFRSLRDGLRPYEIANIYEALAAEAGGKEQRYCSNLTLGPEGEFLPCDKLMGAPGSIRSRFASGRFPGRAVPPAFGSFFSEAASEGCLPGAGPCAVAPWTIARHCGRCGGASPARFLAGQRGARKIVSAWLGAMAKAGLRFPAFRRAHGAPAPGAAEPGL